MSRQIILGILEIATGKIIIMLIKYIINFKTCLDMLTKDKNFTKKLQDPRTELLSLCVTKVTG
uniref:Uncharacterized protein n=1 Tax=Megaselia scalaris TaxID=36166 RepID=T1GM02_MEGSC